MNSIEKYSALSRNLSDIESRTEKAAQIVSREIKPMNVTGSGEVKVEASWGDPKGTKINVSASGQISDKNGNFVKAEVKQNGDGQGSASVSAGNKRKGEKDQ